MRRVERIRLSGIYHLVDGSTAAVLAVKDHPGAATRSAGWCRCGWWIGPSGLDPVLARETACSSPRSNTGAASGKRRVVLQTASMLRGAPKMLGVLSLAKPAAAVPIALKGLDAADRRLVPSNIELPLYVRQGVEAYMLDNPGTAFGTVVLAGFRKLGIAIEDEDLVPERAMRKVRARGTSPDDTPNTLSATTLRVPRYARVRAEAYLLDHPDMRLRHLVMAGFRKLGIHVEPDDLIAERTNVLAQARRPAKETPQ